MVERYCVPQLREKENSTGSRWYTGGSGGTSGVPSLTGGVVDNRCDINGGWRLDHPIENHSEITERAYKYEN